MSSPVLAEVDHAAVTPVSLTDTPAQAVFGFRHRNEMYMVRHKAVRPDLHIALIAPFGHQVDVRLIVFIPEEGGQPPVAPLSDMMGDAGSYDTSNTGHVRKLSLL